MDKAKRNLNVEVLRCFLMVMICIYHGSNNGPFQVAGQNPETKVIGWMLTWATNAFIFISGWYGIRFSWKRLGKFLGMGVYAAAVLFLISKWVIGSWHFRFSLGWFGNSYLALMLIAPLINAALESLYKESPKMLLNAWLCYAVAMAISWVPCRFLNIDLAVPGWYGHSFNTLLFIYVSAFVLRRCEWFTNLKVRTAAFYFGAALFTHLLFMVLIVKVPWVRTQLDNALDYNSPAVLVMAAMIFLVFAKTEFPRLLQRACGWAAASTFSIYLLHAGGLSKVGRAWFNQLILSICDNKVLAVVLGSTLAFFICLGVDAIRRSALAVITRCFFSKEHY